MSSLWIALMALWVAAMTYRQAKARGQWSWRGFAWTMALLAAYLSAVLGVLWMVNSLANLNVALAATGVVAVIGIVIVAIVGKRIQKRYLPPSG